MRQLKKPKFKTRGGFCCGILFVDTTCSNKYNHKDIKQHIVITNILLDEPIIYDFRFILYYIL